MPGAKQLQFINVAKLCDKVIYETIGQSIKYNIYYYWVSIINLEKSIVWLGLFVIGHNECKIMRLTNLWPQLHIIFTVFLYG